MSEGNHYGKVPEPTLNEKYETERMIHENVSASFPEETAKNEVNLVIKAMIEMLNEAGRKRASIVFGVHLKSGLSEEKVRKVFQKCK